ncbi:hypothetical protein LCI18_007810 [Fusarium solani-melongenae]|uniref:Uncharacterized protein n=1 Tax=Fusarium solani subsp. cucurbitae TaxID=2747967 RepID=A0ACD3Z6L9_FUSSC|nr:hypothetical protein LCI18_007810 [Fusarium solani-melongenae]
MLFPNSHVVPDVRPDVPRCPQPIMRMTHSTEASRTLISGRFTTAAMTAHELLSIFHMHEHLSPLHPLTRGAASLRHSWPYVLTWKIPGFLYLPELWNHTLHGISLRARRMPLPGLEGAPSNCSISCTPVFLSSA